MGARPGPFICGPFPLFHRDYLCFGLSGWSGRGGVPRRLLYTITRIENSRTPFSSGSFLPTGCFTVNRATSQTPDDLRAISAFYHSPFPTRRSRTSGIFSIFLQNFISETASEGERRENVIQTAVMKSNRTPRSAFTRKLEVSYTGWLPLICISAPYRPRQPFHPCHPVVCRCFPTPPSSV